MILLKIINNISVWSQKFGTLIPTFVFLDISIKKLVELFIIL